MQLTLFAGSSEHVQLRWTIKQQRLVDQLQGNNEGFQLLVGALNISKILFTQNRLRWRNVATSKMPLNGLQYCDTFIAGAAVVLSHTFLNFFLFEGKYYSVSFAEMLTLKIEKRNWSKILLPFTAQEIHVASNFNQDIYISWQLKAWLPFDSYGCNITIGALEASCPKGFFTRDYNQWKSKLKHA